MQHKTNNTKYNNYLSAATLPVVMVVSVLVLLVVLFVYSLWEMNLLYYSSYHYKRQQQENLNSAIVLYGNDSTFLREYGEEKVFKLYETDDASTVSYIARQWGLYESVHVTSHNGKFSSTRLLGKKQECGHKAALWLCDRNRALSLSGETQIRGKVFIPPNGINYTEVGGEYYKGEEIPPVLLGTAGPQLPPIDSSYMAFMEGLEENRTRSAGLPVATKPYYSFQGATTYFVVTEGQGDIILRGNAVLYADELHITASSKINEAIIVARKVTIEDGFTGNMQLFCSDTVLVGENVTLQYPSGICLEAKVDRPFVSLSGNSEINGYVVVLGRARDEELLFPCFRQSEKTMLRGLLYVDGTTNIQGEISGAAYLKDCFYASGTDVYAGTLHDTRISRNDNIAYPVFLLGSHTRKEVKSIY